MRERRYRWVGILFAAPVLACGSNAIAQNVSAGNFAQTLFRGTEFAGNPLFLSNPQGGPLFDFNDFSQRIEFNRAGAGWTYEFFRFFGTDSFNNINFLDLGPFKLELGPDPTLGQSQRVGLHGRTGFTTRLIPEVFFDAQTGQRTFNQFSGVTGFSPEPIRYRATFNAGVEDFEWTGNMSIDGKGRMNLLGFYDFEMRLTNVGEFDADGVLLDDEGVTDFDIGPIDVSGHIVFDVIASFFQAGGADGAAVPARILSGAAQKEKTVDDLLAQLESGQGLTDEEAEFLIQQMFITAFQSDPLGTLLNGLPTEVPGFEALTVSVSQPDPVLGSDSAAATTPEPTMILLFALLALLSLAFRPMTRHLKMTGGAAQAP